MHLGWGGKRVFLLAPNRLLNILQCKGKHSPHPITKNYSAQNVNSAAVEKLYLSLAPQSKVPKPAASAPSPENLLEISGFTQPGPIELVCILTNTQVINGHVKV